MVNAFLNKKKYDKEYKKKYKEKIKEKMKQKINCPICNSLVRKNELKRHQKTKKCKSFSQSK